MQGVVVKPSVITSTNTELKISGGVETVTVEARAETIQNESGELSTTILQVDVIDLPYMSLNPYQPAVSLPGVTKGCHARRHDQWPIFFSQWTAP